MQAVTNDQLPIFLSLIPKYLAGKLFNHGCNRNSSDIGAIQSLTFKPLLTPGRKWRRMNLRRPKSNYCKILLSILYTNVSPKRHDSFVYKFKKTSLVARHARQFFGSQSASSVGQPSTNSEGPHQADWLKLGAN